MNHFFYTNSIGRGRFLRASACLLFGLVVGSCGVSEQVQRARPLQGFEIRLAAVDQASLAGIDVSQVRQSSDLTAPQQAVIGAAYATGKLPLLLRVKLEVRNPNDEDATLNEMEYIALLDGKQIAAGRIANRLEVRANGGTSAIPLTIETTLRSTEAERSEAAMLTLASGLANRERIAVRVKPTFSTNSGRISLPGGYVLAGQEFRAR
ncbi:MAG TPA: LEA type 2 family protein [Hymenobacter sp.]|jgi:hypothetical protein|uniref:LEA type 2 family protein n=1 Tax=Hymenobacter sp. TaxID=1898978 RepID=UPI002ED92D4C